MKVEVLASLAQQFEKKEGVILAENWSLKRCSDYGGGTYTQFNKGHNVSPERCFTCECECSAVMMSSGAAPQMLNNEVL